MDIRYGVNPEGYSSYDTQQLRDEFLIEELYRDDMIVAVYSHYDRMVVLGCKPVSKAVSLDDGIDVRREFGCDFFLEHREIGMFNLGGPGAVIADDVTYELGHKDCLYLTRGVREVRFTSDLPQDPGLFYLVSAPAHTSFENKRITKEMANTKSLGAVETANRRTLNQFIHPDVLQTCQLSMGLTELETGSVWNTMPAHTHERRTEVYTYFDLAADAVVVHLMGRPQQTRHLIVGNHQAVVSPPWSIHAGVGTGSYSFIWAMGGENRDFDDMDPVSAIELR